MILFVMTKFIMFLISSDVCVALTGAVSMTHHLEQSDHGRSVLWLSKAL